MPRYDRPDMTTREGRAGLTMRLAERGEGPGVPPGERFADSHEEGLLRSRGWRKTLVGTLWIAPGGGLYSVDEALAVVNDAGDMNTSDGLGG